MPGTRQGAGFGSESMSIPCVRQESVSQLARHNRKSFTFFRRTPYGDSFALGPARAAGAFLSGTIGAGTLTLWLP